MVFRFEVADICNAVGDYPSAAMKFKGHDKAIRFILSDIDSETDILIMPMWAV